MLLLNSMILKCPKVLKTQNQINKVYIHIYMYTVVIIQQWTDLQCYGHFVTVNCTVALYSNK
jgi:hypothetical protein